MNGQQVQIGGDVITTMDGQAVTAMEQLAQIIGSKNPGDTVTLSLLRDGQKSDVQVTLGDRSGQQGQGQQGQQGQGQQGQGQQQAPQGNARGWLGISGMTLTRMLPAP